jgi:1-aminocyclopropane-1-carboxylate deaminase/D-cysteine desulfhydrase-like pyridoxal-dependent ACC family enzyme
MTIALFDAYPRLAESIARVKLCNLPTPVRKVQAITEADAYIKLDGVSAPEFGGNKVRTLEFLLGAAAQRKIPRAFVVGLAGTSMALGSAIYSKREHLNLAVILLRQQTTEDARRNLLVFKQLGAELYHVNSITELRLRILRFMLSSLIFHRRLPFMLNPNSPLGMTGYVNMGFELREQIRHGQLPEPDNIYIPMGLRGTATGLLLGLRAAGLKSRLTAVSVAALDLIKAKAGMVANARKLNSFLRQREPDFPLVSFHAEDFEIRCGAQKQEHHDLGVEGMEQIETVWEKDAVRLDATWTAPAWAIMQRDLRTGRTTTPLFWHTYNSQPLPNIEKVDYRNLPKGLHVYFQEPVTLANRPMLGKH